MMIVKPLKRPALATAILFAVASFYTIGVSADPPDTQPNGKGIGTIDHPGNGNANGNAGRKQPGNGITWHGGPVLVAGSNVYYIWYGKWGSNTATTILPKLPPGLSGSPYFNINTTYYDGTGHVQNAVSPVTQYTYPDTPYGTSLTDASVQSIVRDTINLGHLALDAEGVYFVLTSAEVHETSGFCTQYCGWHTHFTLNGNDVKYAFVGNGDQCPSACEAQTTSPNGNAGADGMASVISHELEEATTDPDLNAWYDSKGNENADKCAWTFGATKPAPNGSKYNMALGGTNFLIQQNWVNASGGYCALSY
jgi:hypothetical protein